MDTLTCFIGIQSKTRNEKLHTRAPPPSRLSDRQMSDTKVHGTRDPGQSDIITHEGVAICLDRRENENVCTLKHKNDNTKETILIRNETLLR
jgi:hypothetical protein